MCGGSAIVYIYISLYMSVEVSVPTKNTACSSEVIVEKKNRRTQTKRNAVGKLSGSAVHKRIRLLLRANEEKGTTAAVLDSCRSRMMLVFRAQVRNPFARARCFCAHRPGTALTSLPRDECLWDWAALSSPLRPASPLTVHSKVPAQSPWVNAPRLQVRSGA